MADVGELRICLTVLALLGHEESPKICLATSCHGGKWDRHSRKLTWIPKMMVWKRWTPLKYDHFWYLLLNFWGISLAKILLSKRCFKSLALICQQTVQQ